MLHALESDDLHRCQCSDVHLLKTDVVGMFSEYCVICENQKIWCRAFVFIHAFICRLQQEGWLPWFSNCLSLHWRCRSACSVTLTPTGQTWSHLQQEGWLSRYTNCLSLQWRFGSACPVTYTPPGQTRRLSLQALTVIFFSATLLYHGTTQGLNLKNWAPRTSSLSSSMYG